MIRRLLIAVGLVAGGAMLAGCGDGYGDDDPSDIDSGDGGVSETTAGNASEPDATHEGTIDEVHAFVPITEDCVPAADLDPDGAVSSDDLPVCTDPATAPLGSILVGGEIVFTIRQDTVLTSGPEDSPISFDDLAVGDTVEIGFNGQIAESFPAQATADAVHVV